MKTPDNKTTLKIASKHVHNPMTIIPGAVVALEVEGELQPGDYRFSIEPENLAHNMRVEHGALDFGEGVWKVEKGVSGIRIVFDVPSNIALSGSGTFEVIVRRSGPPVGFSPTTTGEASAEASVPPSESIEAARMTVPFVLEGGANQALRSGVDANNEPIAVSIVRKESVPSNYTRSIVMHRLISKGCERLNFNFYRRYMDYLLCDGENPESLELGRDRSGDPIHVSGKEIDVHNRANQVANRLYLPFSDTQAYRILKMATEAFVLVMSEGLPTEKQGQLAVSDNEIKSVAKRIGAVVDIPNTPVADFHSSLVGGRIPYLVAIFERLESMGEKTSLFSGFDEARNWFIRERGQRESCRGVLRDKLTKPILIELIWSYWHEQAMQVQTMHAVRNRFQNIRLSSENDPLASMEIGVLRPLNNLLWGYIQDEQHRLTLARRNYEYEHHYGLSLRGKAVPTAQPVERRSKFLEAFHNLLYISAVYFKEDDDTNRRADAFPVLNALKEVHFLLSEGAHNQFNDLPTTSRIEMLMEQWLLARPEFQSFLPSRESVAYPEDWMGSVDAMKTLQGWNSTSVMFFNDLARYGEMLLLSIRYGHWSVVADRDEAANWAKIWRSQIQGYIHAYRIVTGVDLSIEPDRQGAEFRRRDPSLLIQDRWEEQKRAGLARPSSIQLAPSPTAGAWAQPRLSPKR
ncbi:MAG TPA: hypothetical protein PKD54_07750 [Pirellulaceae bacterium]|nr:hypothetical protein [Pirellulaceae bacterium]